MGVAWCILALEGRAAVEHEEEEVEEDEEDELNVPPAASVVAVALAVAAVLSVVAVVPLPGSRDAAVDTGDEGIWEGSSGWF